MNYLFLKSILSSSWQVDWPTFQQYYPLLKGAFSGMVFGEGEEEGNCQPFQIDVLNDAGNGKTARKSVQVIPVRGLMTKHDMDCGPKGMRTIGSRLVEGEKAGHIAGSILLFESGGGQTDAVPELTDAIKNCIKPVVAFIDGRACSAAMYAASYCKEIIASRPTDVVGSIGTMIASEGFEQFSKDENGLIHFRVYADGSEDKNGEYENALKGDFKLIKESLLNPVNEQFKADVRANRPKVTDGHLTGKIYKASEVMGVLVDSIGALNTAAERVAELAKTEPSFAMRVMENYAELSDAVKEMGLKTQSKIINMNEFPLLLAVLGTTELAVQEGQTSLNTDQLEMIEKALEAAATAKTSLQAATTKLQTATTDLQQANERIAVLETELEKKPGAESLLDDTDDGEGTENKDSFGTRYNAIKNDLKEIS